MESYVARVVDRLAAEYDPALLRRRQHVITKTYGVSSMEESDDLDGACRAAGLALVRLVTPTTPRARRPLRPCSSTPSPPRPAKLERAATAAIRSKGSVWSWSMPKGGCAR